jgi:hypothetical protein
LLLVSQMLLLLLYFAQELVLRGKGIICHMYGCLRAQKIVSMIRKAKNSTFYVSKYTVCTPVCGSLCFLLFLPICVQMKLRRNQTQKIYFFPQFVLVPPLHSLSHPQPPSSQCDTNVAVTAAAAAALAMLLLRTPYERSSLADSVAAVR